MFHRGHGATSVANWPPGTATHPDRPVGELADMVGHVLQRPRRLGNSISQRRRRHSAHSPAPTPCGSPATSGDDPANGHNRGRNRLVERRRRRTRPPAEAGPPVGPTVVVAGRLGSTVGYAAATDSLTTIRTPRSPWSTTRDTPYPTSNQNSCASSSLSSLLASSARADPDQARPRSAWLPGWAKGGM
jgi:hypothetical protein